MPKIRTDFNVAKQKKKEIKKERKNKYTNTNEKYFELNL